MPIALRVLLLGTALASAPIALAQAPAASKADPLWCCAPSDLERDASIRFGRLPNGMRYAIQRNTTPQNGASIRMRIDVGSTAEAEDQRGLAHFLEHMAFNGSKNVPEGEMVKMLERFGLAFGADTNASTGFTETIYQLDLPRAEDAPIDTAMLLMREIAGELNLDSQAIERERGVILSERRARDQFGLRRLEHYIGFALPGTPVATRLPIGTADVIQTAKAERFRDLYERFYVPERTTLIVVGDVDPAAIEAKIKTRFSNWTRATRGAEAVSTIDPARASQAAYFRDPDVPASVSILAVKPLVERADSVAERERTLLEGLGNAIVSRRLARIARAADAPILGGSSSGGELFGAADYASLDIGAKGEDWRGALALGEQELRRALEHGFTQAELAEQLANVRTGIENAAKAESTRRSEALADGIAQAIEDDRVVTTPTYRLALFERLAPRLTVQAVEAAYRARWAGANRLVHVSGKSAIDRPETTILAALADSAKVAVAAPKQSDATSFAYTDFGAPGRVVEDKRVADLGIRQLRFANNVRLNLKQTDFERDRVRLSLRVGGGALEFGKDQPGLALFMNNAFAAGGLAKHPYDDLQSLTAGRAVSVGLGAGADAFGSTTATTPRDLLLQLQLFAAYLTAPGFGAEGDAQWRRSTPVFYETLDASPAAVAGRDVPRILASGDPRFGVPALAALEARDMADLRPALARAFASGAVEIGVVGDIDEAAVIEMVAKTFGALPARAADPAPLAEARAVRFPAERAPIVLRHAGKADEAVSMTYWPTTDDKDHVTDARLSLLAATMRLLLTDELREALGATYSPGASSNTSSIYPEYGFFGVSGNVDVKDLAAVDAAVARIAARLRDAPVDDDLLLRARRPILEAIDKSKRENGTWLGVLSRAQTEPRFIERFRNARPVYEAITPADLQAAAKLYLTAQPLRIRVIAEGAPT